MIPRKRVALIASQNCYPLRAPTALQVVIMSAQW
jgi:hypothetical protein